MCTRAYEAYGPAKAPAMAQRRWQMTLQDCVVLAARLLAGTGVDRRWQVTQQDCEILLGAARLLAGTGVDRRWQVTQQDCEILLGAARLLAGTGVDTRERASDGQPIDPGLTDMGDACAAHSWEHESARRWQSTARTTTSRHIAPLGDSADGRHSQKVLSDLSCQYCSTSAVLS